ncbi:importin subunit alpha-2 [Stylonychia lemnae]|uniref:Importin subunit alpha-2 n=1 Tax=Stylonychia lemnae TaxID=5949 RepID=A0A078AVH8_STYLE|nr:importin subunit alpha-2 [Stylonychia lemnae]|eukprot:CDW84833.1 importin subunit alpha-2 [Stylonychia lemnae]
MKESQLDNNSQKFVIGKKKISSQTQESNCRQLLQRKQGKSYFLYKQKLYQQMLRNSNVASRVSKSRLQRQRNTNNIADPLVPQSVQSDSVEIMLARNRKLKLNLESICVEIRSQILDTKCNGVTKLRKVLMTKDPPIYQIIDCLIIKELLTILSQTFISQQTKIDITWIFTNLSSGTYDQVMSLFNHGVINALIHVLSNQSNLSSISHIFLDNSDELLMQTQWALSNIILGNSQTRDYAIDLGVVPLAVAILGQSQRSFITHREAVFLLCNLVRAKQLPPFPKIQMILTSFCYKLKHLNFNAVEQDQGKCQEQIEVIINMLDFIAIIQSQYHEYVEIQIQKSNFHLELVAMMQTSVSSIMLYVSDIVGNLCMISDQVAVKFIKSNIIEVIVERLLRHDYSPSEIQVKTKLFWILQNLKQRQIDVFLILIEMKFIKELTLIYNNSDYATKFELIYMVAFYLRRIKYRQLLLAIEQDLMKFLVNCLRLQDVQGQIIQLTLISLSRIFKKTKNHTKSLDNDIVRLFEQYGGIDLVESLQLHNSEDVYESAFFILNTYFEIERKV